MQGVRQGAVLVLFLFIRSNRRTATNDHKTAQDVYRDVSEPPQSPPKPRGGKKARGSLRQRLPQRRLSQLKRHEKERRRTTNSRGQPRATRRRAARARRRRRNTQAQHAPAAPPVRRLDEKRAKRLGRLAPLDVDGSVAPARRPRLAPAFARSWERRTNSRDSGRAVAVQGRRPAVYTYTIKADAEPATEFQRDASTKAPGDGSL